MNRPSKYFGDRSPKTVGRTRLLRGTTPVHEPVGPGDALEASETRENAILEDSTAGPVLTPSPIEPFHGPEARKWRKHQEPATRKLFATQTPARVGPPVWDGEHLHDNCGGFVDIRPDGASGLYAKCARCGQDWMKRRGVEGWIRG